MFIPSPIQEVFIHTDDWLGTVQPLGHTWVNKAVMVHSAVEERSNNEANSKQIIKEANWFHQLGLTGASG